MRLSALRWPLVCYLLAVEILAVGLTVLRAVTADFEPYHFGATGLLIMLGLVVGEVSRRIELTRRRQAGSPYVDMTSVWYFSAALLLPPGLSALVVVVLYLHRWCRGRLRLAGEQAYRSVFSASTIVLACITANAVQQLDRGERLGLADLALTLAAMVAFSAVNLGLVATAIGMTTRRWQPRLILGGWNDNALETTTLCLGALAATAFVTQPWPAVLLVIPPTLMLYRLVLVRQLERAASTDPKTGMLNSSAWQQATERELARADREQATVGVLMTDLDNFKEVNDLHGHIVGDIVLRAVADALRGELREYDLIGRFGGDEFTITLPGVDAEQLAGITGRLQRRIRDLTVPAYHDDGRVLVTGLTVSIGAAIYPDSADRLHRLLVIADNALLAAKDAGRDQVQVKTRPPADT